MKNASPLEFNNIIDAYILFTIFIFTLLINALSVLFELFTYGIFKKEILTDRSKLGFDITIKM